MTVIVLSCLATACSRLPLIATPDSRSVSAALSDTADTTLGRAITGQLALHPGLNGVHPLPDGLDAFAARMLLARRAERSLDVQYYIWRNDLTGTLLLQALVDAARRGVRVRLLLDDNNTAGLDGALAVLAAQPNIEVRLFNPFANRNVRWLGYLTDFSRLNRRMHNKSITADNQATIVGGRNIGDAYFDASDGVLFADLDVLVTGPVVRAVSDDFDRYWSSGSTYPVSLLLPSATPQQTEALRAKVVQVSASPQAAKYVEAVRRSDFVERLIHGDLAMQWVPVRLIADDPAKGLGTARPDAMFPARLNQALGRPERSLDLVSPYFVPGKTGGDELAELARAGVRVRVLTNALEATDVAVVHSGYAKRRRAMLEAGIALYEWRRTAGETGKRAVSMRQMASAAGSGGSGAGGSGIGSSASSLHAKTIAVDDDRVFVGSFNFDPRSARLNTELGFVIDSPLLAVEMAQFFDKTVPDHAFEVRLDDNGALVWLERHNGMLTRHDVEPGTSWWQRAWIRVLSTLPIEWML